MNNNKLKLFIIIFLVFFITPSFALAGGEYFCVWNSNNNPPCQYTGDTCSDGDIPGDCSQFNLYNDCQLRQHNCIENTKAMTLEVNYPPIPTPYGYMDLDEMASRGEVTISAIVVFLYSVSLWVAGLIAFAGLIFAGFTYIWAGASPSAKNRAMRRFKNTLWGLAILLLANVLINYINPNISKLELAEVFGISAQENIYESPNIQINVPDIESTATECVVVISGTYAV